MLLTLLLCLPAILPQEPELSDRFSAIADDVRFHKMENGLRLVVLPWGDAPLVAFHTYIQAGAIDEETGLTGLAHFAEHMAFKGSRRIGSKNWSREEIALERTDRAWRAYEAVLDTADEEAIAEAKEAFLLAEVEANSLVESELFSRVLERAGGDDMNATTSADCTRYFVSLPANRLELWFWMQRERYLDPAMREFYKERDVVREERRMRIDSRPSGALMEAVLNAAFAAHPYRDSTIGHMDDLEHLDRIEMREFFKRHYTADRIVLAVVGRVDPDRVIDLAEQYLDDIPPRRGGRPRRTAEPLQRGQRIVHVEMPAQPSALLAYRCPPLVGESAVTWGALSEILATGPASRLHRRLVQDERAAVSVASFAGYPGKIDPTLLFVWLDPAPGRTNQEVITLAEEEIARLAAGGPTVEELDGTRKRAEVRFWQSFETAPDIARALATAEAEQGGWRELFRTVERLQSLTAEQVAAAAASLEVSSRTTGHLILPGGER